MPMEDDPDKINDAGRFIQAKLYEQAQGYAETRVESKKLNERRATSRKKVMELGFRSDAYQTGIRIVKDLSARERGDFIRDLDLIVKVLGKRQSELFPEEALKAAKREEQRKAENKPKSKAEKDAKSDANPRSNPAKGGAGKAKAAPATAVGDQTIKDVAEKLNADAEQADGEAALKDGLPQSQSAQAAAIKDRLGIN